MVLVRPLTFALVASALAACGIDAVGTLADVPAVDRPDPDGTTAGDADERVDAGEADGSSPSDASIDADDAASDVFVPGDGGNVTLTVSMLGAPAGTTVTSNGGGIDCPGTCSVNVPAGTKLNLTANVSGDVSLSSWSGACVGREPTCALTVSTTTFVTATFAPLLHYMHSATALYSVNGSTGATTSVATFNGGCTGISVGDLAIDRFGSAYVATLPPASADSTFHVLNLVTGTCTASLGGMGRRCNGLTFAPDPADPTKDVLYAACTTSFYKVNVANGATTLIGALGTGLASSGDIVWMPGRGVFITLNDAAATDKLGWINVATGAATVIGTGVGRDAVYSLGYRGGALLGYGNDFAIRIDPVTGAGSAWNTATGIDSYGAASGP